MNIRARSLSRFEAADNLVRPLRQWLARPLRIDLNGRRLEFADLDAFDFALRARTAMPTARIVELYTRTESELEAEIIGVGGLEKKMRGVLAGFVEHSVSLARTLQQTGLMMISLDYDWRTIFEQLLQVNTRGEAYLRLACERYLDYLAQRRDMIAAIALLRARERQRAAAGTDLFVPELATHACAPAPQLAGNDPERTGLRRLPQGEAVVLRLAAGRELLIRLARHDFSLAHDRDWALIAENGQRYVLRDGINSVGRSRDNSIAVDSTFRNVSRKHLLAHPVGGDSIVLTDVSSSGTFIAPAALAS